MGSITELKTLAELNDLLKKAGDKLTVGRMKVPSGFFTLTRTFRLLISMQHGRLCLDRSCIQVSHYSTRCGPCHAIAPKYAALAKEHTNVNFTKCDVDAVPAIAKVRSFG